MKVNADLFYIKKTTSCAGGTKELKAVRKDKKALLWYNKARFRHRAKKTKGEQQKMDNNSLAHTRWNCKYHIVFAPKYRRKAIYGEYKKEIGKILRELCTWKGVEIIEAHACVDHIHMYVSIPPKISVSGFVGFLKGKSSLIIFERHTNLKYKYGQRHFWCRGYYVDTVTYFYGHKIVNFTSNVGK